VLGEVPAFTTLSDHSGASFASASLKDKVWVADFFFTSCPGPCPRMSSQMHQVQQAFLSDDRLRLLSFTVDPKHDTAPVLAEYSKHFEAVPGKWFFLTGPVKDLDLLGREAFKLGGVDGSLEHSTRFALVDGAAKIRGYYQTSEKDAIGRLIADARRLLREKS
jgi:protein SCO1/2